MTNSRFWGRLLVALAAFPQLLIKPLRKQPVHMRRILVLSHLLLGDTLMLTALLKSLRLRYPDAVLTLVCPQAIAPLYESRPYNVEAVGFNPGSLASVYHLVRYYRKYDLAYIPGDNRWSWLALAMGSRWVIAFTGGKAWKNLPVNELKPFPSSLMAWGDLVASLADNIPEVVYYPGDWLPPSYLPFDVPEYPYAVLHLGASKPHKYWAANNWMVVADWLRSRGITVVWSVGSKEVGLLQSIQQHASDYCYQGNLDLAQLWHLLQQAWLLICPDTGIAHLGRLTNTNTIALFGPGSPLISGAGGFWCNSPFVALWDKDIPCRNMTRLFQREIPWVKHCLRGSRECQKPSCMTSLKSELVISQVEVFIDAGSLNNCSGDNECQCS